MGQAHTVTRPYRDVILASRGCHGARDDVGPDGMREP